jgi:hypothetical protein
MSGIIKEAFQDAQTSITSLSAAGAGALSEKVGSMLIARSGIAKDSGIGQIGLQFAVRALVASASFGAVSSFMPATSENIFFSILFFAANPSLVKDGAMLGKTAADALFGLAAPGRVVSMPLRGGKKASSCANGGCPQ